MYKNALKMKNSEKIENLSLNFDESVTIVELCILNESFLNKLKKCI